MKKGKKIILRLLLWLLVISHHLALWMITLSVPLLFLKEPIWISLPLSAWVMHLGCTRLNCPLTRYENYLRRNLGMPEIETFLRHYYVNRIRKKT